MKKITRKTFENEFDYLLAICGTEDMRLIETAVKNNPNINYVNKDNQTILDWHLYWADQIYNNGFSDENRTQKKIDLLIKHGAKTYAQLAKESNP